MLSTHNIAIDSMFPHGPGNSPKGNGRSETEGFDFSNYLLGLQGANPKLRFDTVSIEEKNSGFLSQAGKELNSSQEELLSLFDKNDETKGQSVGLVLSGLIPSGPTAQPLVPTQTLGEESSKSIPSSQHPPWLGISIPSAVFLKAIDSPQKERSALSASLSTAALSQELSEGEGMGEKSMSSALSQRATGRAIDNYTGLIPVANSSEGNFPVQGKERPEREFDPGTGSRGADSSSLVISRRTAEGEATQSEEARLRRQLFEGQTDVLLSNVSSDGHTAQGVGSPLTGEIASQGGTHSVRMEQLFDRVDSLIQQGGGKMTVSLHPPNLGQVEIQVTARGNRVEVEMKSESDQAKSAIESHFADLRHSLQAQDLIVSRLEVHVGRDFDRSVLERQSQFSQTLGQNLSSTNHGFSGHAESGNSFAQSSPRSIPTRSMPSSAMVAEASAGSTVTGRVDIRI